MIEILHARSYGRFTETKRYRAIQRDTERVHRTSQIFNFVRSSFSNRYSVRASVLFIREHVESQYFARLLFLKERPIHKKNQEWSLE